AQFDLTLTASENEKGIELELNYASQIFLARTAERFLEYYLNILECIALNPEVSLSDIEMVSERERKQLLYELNDTAADYPKHKTIQELFEEQVERTPERIAVIFEDRHACARELTYRELNQKANQLAGLIRERGVGSDSIVAIMVERSFEMIIGIMAILKAGGAYLPIAPTYPAERIQYMLEDSGSGILLTAGTFPEQLQFHGEVIELGDARLYQGATQNLAKISSSNHLAYVIYTSGSTGKPKGTMIEHYSVINRLNWMQKQYPLNDSDVILQKTPFTFDVSVWELFWWSACGAQVCMLTPGGEKDPESIIAAVQRNQVTIIHFVPSMLNAFLEYLEGYNNVVDGLSSLRRVFASGEALNITQVKKFNAILNTRWGTMLHNLYGPTEATVDVSYFDCSTGAELGTVPIGKPIDNIQLYVVDQANHLQPIGVAGELCIAGDGLARGYLNRPELTGEKFVVRAAPPQEGIRETPQRIYRTGDLARWLPDGNVEYLGRIDNQVKLRGFRIELGEIEVELLKHTGISEAVVIAREDKEGNKYLCAYIVSGAELTVGELRTHLSARLPEYMIPSSFIQLEYMPLTPNGKIDRRSLVDQKNLSEPGVPGTGGKYAAPRNELEKLLCDIWREVLNIEIIGIDDDFFEVGGHSLLVMKLEVAMEKADLRIENADIFKYRTIRNIAALLQGERETITAEPIKNQNKKAVKPFYGRKLDIHPIHYDYLTCFEDILVTVAEWAGYHYELYFADAWSFIFDSENCRRDHNVGRWLKVASVDGNEELVLRHGLEMIWGKAASLPDLIEVIRTELDNNWPVVVSMDSFVCPWDWNYQKLHNTHSFVISGMDDNTGLLYCCDGFYQTCATIPKEELMKGLKGEYGLFRFAGPARISVNWREILEDALAKLQTAGSAGTAFDSMRSLAEILVETELQNEIRGHEGNLFEAPLVKHLEHITYGRRKFAKLLDYFGEETGLREFPQLAGALREVASQWANVRALLVKEAFSQDNIFKNRAIPKIREIADLEEGIAMRLAQVCRNQVDSPRNFSNRYSTQSKQKKAEESASTGKPVMADLTPFFNNKAFGEGISVECPADLTGTGIYFLKKNIPSHDIWKIGAMEFKFPDLEHQVYDNVSCNGQRIQIENEGQQKLMILGCSEWGSFSDNLAIHYVDGRSEALQVKFSDWLYKPMFGEALAWEGKAVEKIGSSAQLRGGKVYLSAHQYDLQLRSKIDYIQLPDCPGMHIFAISLI
ncbi:MAG TPA: amino acid adenylation domain-containing protein, partial [Bacillota bacterium]|nr:amino acid adenylation domain-containing protein [Bacillota bacterium]